MATIEVTTQTPLRLTLDGTVDNGEVVSDLTPAAMATKLGVTATGSALITAANAAAARTTLGVNVEAIVVQCYVAAATAGRAMIAVPSGISGTVTSIQAVNSADPGGDLVITSAIGPSGGPFVPITNGAVTVANTTAGGTITAATPTAANTVVGGTSVLEVWWDDGAANACNVTVTMLVTRT